MRVYLKQKKVKNIYVFDAKLRVLSEKNIILDVKHQCEGVSEAKKVIKLLETGSCTWKNSKNESSERNQVSTRQESSECQAGCD